MKNPPSAILEVLFNKREFKSLNPREIDEAIEEGYVQIFKDELMFTTKTFLFYVGNREFSIKQSDNTIVRYKRRELN